MNRKFLKYAVSGLFLVTIFWLTFRLLFAGQELPEILADIAHADPAWLLPGAAAALGYVAGEGSVICYMLCALGQKTPLFHCIKYSFIGFFFSYITPSSSGGQPAQMYYMKRDGIRIGHSTLIMVLITILYKSVLVILGALLLVLRFQTVLHHAGKMGWLLALGFVLNIAFIALLSLAALKPERAKRAGVGLVGWLTRRGILREQTRTKLTGKIERVCATYSAGAAYLRSHKSVLVTVLLLTLAERLCMLVIPWFVYHAYGLSGYSLIDIVTLQVMISVAVEMLPLPGAAGITEGCFFMVFTDIFGPETVGPGLLVSRGLSFYLVLIAGGIVTLLAHIQLVRRARRGS